MHSDAEAQAYAKADFEEVNELFVQTLLAMTASHSRLWALDLGTGPADIASRVAACQPGWIVVPLDASWAMLKIAKARTQAPLRLVLGDAKRLPFPDNSFDVVFSNSILHHITDTHVFWAEVQRVAKQGGLLFLRDLRRPANETEAQNIVETYSGEESGLLKEEFLRSLLAAYTPEEVKEQLSRAGLYFLSVREVSDRHLDVWGRLR